MPVFILQTILLLLIAYILGCILGCLFHQWFGADAPSAKASTGAAGAGIAAAGVAAAVAKPAAAKPVAAVSADTKPAEPVAFTAAPKPTAPPLVDDTVSAPKPATVKSAPAPKSAAAKAAPKPAAVAAAAPSGKKDDLKRIRGIGKQNEARLNAVDVKYFSQIAAWSKKDQQEMGERLAFPGRIEREEWVAQAKLLAAGKDTDFSKRVDKGEVATSKGRGNVGDLGKKPSTMAKAKASGADNLTLIDGVGNAIEKKLNELGIFHFSQIAKWTADNETWVSNEIGFPGRSQRENWVAESKILAAGGTTEHAKRVEGGQISSSRKSTDDEK